MLKRRFSRGDTLVEVMFAVAIFSLIAVGSLSIMNQGTATAQRALEITLVRQEIDSQAEALRFLNSSYIAASQSGASVVETDPSFAGQWKNIDVKHTVTDEPALESVSQCPKTWDSRSFILDAHLAKVSPIPIEMASTFSQVVYDPSGAKARGIWIEAVKPSVTPKYIDFHIQACWDSPGQSTPMTLGTIVRLYEPES